MPCIFSRQSSSMPGPSIIMPSTPSTLQANYAILPRENQSVFSPTLHVASVNKIEMNSVIIRLPGQGPLPVKKGEKKTYIFPSISVSFQDLAGLFWSSYGSIHGIIMQLAVDKKRKEKESMLFSSPTPKPSICLRHVHPNIQMYRWKLTHLHLFLHERWEEWLLITRKFHICMMIRNTFDTSQAILMKTCPTFLRLHSKKNNLYESTAVWLDPLHTAGGPGIREREAN